MVFLPGDSPRVDDGDSPRVDGREMTAFFFGVGCKIERRSHPKEGLNQLFSPTFSYLGADPAPEALKALQKILANSCNTATRSPQDNLPACLRLNLSTAGTIPFADPRLIIALP